MSFLQLVLSLDKMTEVINSILENMSILTEYRNNNHHVSNSIQLGNRFAFLWVDSGWKAISHLQYHAEREIKA